MISNVGTLFSPSKKGSAAVVATPPTLSTATVPTDGLTIALTFSVPSQPLLPATSITGLSTTVDGSNATFTAARTSNTVITLTMTATITTGQTVTVSYAPGNITDTATTALAAFGPTAVTNNSTATAVFSVKSLSFGGVNQYANRADSNLQDVTSAMTLSAWVKGSNAADYAGIAEKSDYNTANSYAMMRSGVVAGKPGCFLYDGVASKQYQSSITAFDNTWHHVVMTFGSSTLKIYVDRVLDASPTKTVDTGVTNINTNAIGFRIGSRVGTGTPSNFFNGEINNVSLWSVALNSSEVTALASGGKPTDLSLHSRYASCISWYKCGDGDTIGANGILDTTANALHLSPTNMVSGDIVTDAP